MSIKNSPDYQISAELSASITLLLADLQELGLGGASVLIMHDVS